MKREKMDLKEWEQKCRLPQFEFDEHLPVRQQLTHK